MTSATAKTFDSNIVIGSAGVFLALALIFHFLMTALYLVPLSGPGLAARPAVVAYMEPVFAQRWSLFAPEPPLHDRRFDYECRTDDQRSSGWMTRSAELIDQHARVRLGPANFLRRLEGVVIASALGLQDPVLEALYASREAAPPEAREAIDRAIAAAAAGRVSGSRFGYQLAARYCTEDHGAAPLSVRYRITTRRILSFSKRHQPESREPAEGFEVPWMSPDDLDQLEQRAAEAFDTLMRSRDHDASM